MTGTTGSPGRTLELLYASSTSGTAEYADDSIYEDEDLTYDDSVPAASEVELEFDSDLGPDFESDPEDGDSDGG